MALANFDVVNPLGGTAPAYSLVDQNAIGHDGGLFTQPHTMLANGGNFLRLGPSIYNSLDTTFYLPKAIPSASDEAVDTSIIFSRSHYELQCRPYLLHRWNEIDAQGIRLGFDTDNSLSLDVNRALDGAFSGGYALRMNFSAGWPNHVFHAIRLVTKTYGPDVYMTVYAHLNLTDYNDLTWTKMFAVQHLAGTSTVQYAQYYTGPDLVGFNVGSMNGLTNPRLTGRSGFGVGVHSASGNNYSRYVYVKDFKARLG